MKNENIPNSNLTKENTKMYDFPPPPRNSFIQLQILQKVYLQTSKFTFPVGFKCKK